MPAPYVAVIAPVAPTLIVLLVAVPLKYRAVEQPQLRSWASVPLTLIVLPVAGPLK
jgi:hypothetical protein